MTDFGVPLTVPLTAVGHGDNVRFLLPCLSWITIVTNDSYPGELIHYRVTKRNVKIEFLTTVHRHNDVQTSQRRWPTSTFYYVNVKQPGNAVATNRKTSVRAWKG